MKIHRSFLPIAAVLGLSSLPWSAALHAKEVPNFVLLDTAGKARELRRAESRTVLLFFTGAGCPVVRKSAGKLLELKKQFGADLDVWLVDAELGADAEAARKEASELGLTDLQLLMDAKQAVAQSLDVERTAEAVVIETKTWSVVYRGALDDQLTEGAEKPEPTIKYAEQAIAAHLAGNAVPLARTATRGCRLTFEPTKSSGETVSYRLEVAPILKAHCVTCHRAGDIGPFEFSSYQAVRRKARMMEEVLLTQSMPPWHADPHFGKFANAAALSTAETQTLLRWIKQGAPQDEGSDPLVDAAQPPEEWPMGKPDYIIKLPQVEEIPATGVLDYRHVKIDSPIAEDVWLRAAVVKPGNRKVLHHMIVFAKFEGAENGFEGKGVKIAGWAPGRLPEKLPEGTGLFLGKNAKLNIELHYTTVGTPQTDQTEIGLYVIRDKPKLAYKTGQALKLAFLIPPNEPEVQTSAKFKFAKDSLIYTLTPHMHMRGAWMKYDAIYPDGRRETLLSVPRFNFNWQTAYKLAEPLRVPAGTILQCSGAFDNSPRNPFNPDPSKMVRWGQQSWDEMFIGYVGYSELPPVEEKPGGSL
jgi:peroxiredoxin